MSDSPSLKVIHGQVYATSLDVAEHFHKSHDNVLKAVRRTLNDCSEEFNGVNFDAVNYQDRKGETRPMYRLTRDGFALVAMAFTGKEATQWKEAYIRAFNEMESELRRTRARSGVISQLDLFPNLQAIVTNECPALTLTAALTILSYRRLDIPTVSRNRLIGLIKRGTLVGFRGDSGWMVYEDSFEAWLQHRRAA